MAQLNIDDSTFRVSLPMDPTARYTFAITFTDRRVLEDEAKVLAAHFYETLQVVRGDRWPGQ